MLKVYIIMRKKAGFLSVNIVLLFLAVAFFITGVMAFFAISDNVRSGGVNLLVVAPEGGELKMNVLSQSQHNLIPVYYDPDEDRSALYYCNSTAEAIATATGANGVLRNPLKYLNLVIDSEKPSAVYVTFQSSIIWNISGSESSNIEIKYKSSQTIPHAAEAAYDTTDLFILFIEHPQTIPPNEAVDISVTIFMNDVFNSQEYEKVSGHNVSFDFTVSVV